MRLLVTRAKADARRTRAKLEAMGHVVLESPVIAVAPRGVAWPRDDVAGVIATSAHAFAALADAGAIPATIRAAPLYLVGARTEAAARRAGFVGAAIVAPDGASLGAVPSAAMAGRVLYLAGRDRKPVVEEALAAAGHDVAVLETYAAVAAEAFAPPALAALARGDVDAVLHYSRRAATLFLALASAAAIAPGASVHLCLSSDVADPLRAVGHAVRVAETPDEAGLLAVLAKLMEERGSR